MPEPLTDRWAFIPKELLDPTGCTADDLFQADLPPVNEGDESRAIVVNRRGEPVEVLADGS